VAVGVVDGKSWFVVGQLLTFSLTGSIVLSTSGAGELGSRMDKRPGLGIGTGGGDVPEGTAEVDGSRAALWEN